VIVNKRKLNALNNVRGWLRCAVVAIRRRRTQSHLYDVRVTERTLVALSDTGQKTAGICENTNRAACGEKWSMPARTTRLRIASRPAPDHLRMERCYAPYPIERPTRERRGACSVTSRPVAPHGRDAIATRRLTECSLHFIALHCLPHRSTSPAPVEIGTAAGVAPDFRHGCAMRLVSTGSSVDAT
jgi:hypothetical protein